MQGVYSVEAFVGKMNTLVNTRVIRHLTEILVKSQRMV